MLTIQENTTIYILAPANSASGGQEALHQLGYFLRKNGLTAKMAYYFFNSENKTPVVEKYEKYEVPYCLSNEIPDVSHNLLICPEIATWQFQLFSNIQKSIWWLSVHFYKAGFRHSSILKMIPNVLRGRFKKIKEVRAERKKLFNFDDKSVHHFTASQYAYTYVKSRGANPHKLIEPLGMDFLNSFKSGEPADLSSNGRDQVVLYNPVKESKMMNSLQKKFPEIPFVPLKGFTPDELIEVMKKSVLYVDFGKFPGPERLPKEAAVCGCCIITGVRGASAFYEDVRIPDQYKMRNRSPQYVANLIIDILENYDKYIGKFEEYRNMVRDLESNFELQIKELFQ